LKTPNPISPPPMVGGDPGLVALRTIRWKQETGTINSNYYHK